MTGSFLILAKCLMRLLHYNIDLNTRLPHPDPGKGCGARPGAAEMLQT